MTANNTINIIAPIRREHREALIDLWAKIFGFGGTQNYFTGRAICEAGYLDGSHYDWDASRIGVIDGQIVAHYGVWGYDMRVGSAAVRCGGIGAVCTHPNFRKRGYLLRVANASIDAMREGGYDMSLLFGINGFYDRLGYRRAFAYEEHLVPASDLPTEKPGVAIRKFKAVRREDTDRLSNRVFEGLTGTAVRPTFRKSNGMMKAEGYRWVDGRGRLAGYVYVKHDEANRRLKCYEAVGETTRVLRVLGQLTRKHNATELELINQPIRTPLMQAVRRGRCVVTTRLNPNGGPMARSINLQTTLTKIADELHQRLGDSTMSQWRGSLLIDDGEEKALLRIGARGVTVGEPGKTLHVIKTKGHAVQLIWGTDEPGVVMRDAGMKATGDAAAVVAALFPGQDPGLLPFDHF